MSPEFHFIRVSFHVHLIVHFESGYACLCIHSGSVIMYCDYCTIGTRLAFYDI